MPMTGPDDELDADRRRRLRLYMDRLAESPVSLSSVREGEEAWNTHVRDSLSGLEVAEIRAARRVADLGSGAGFPGIVLAVMQPEAEFDLIESVRRKCDFIGEAAAAAGIENARAICARSESWAREEGREAYDVVTARAVAPLAALTELASPLLREGGALVAWKGARDPEEEARLAAVGGQTAMAPLRVQVVVPFPGSRERHLHVIRKQGPTPKLLPRRPGMARKRPLG